MDSHLHSQDRGVRLSDSPRREPQITEGLKSPARSLKPEMQGMASIYSQTDVLQRPVDFFEDTSDDEIVSVMRHSGDVTGIEAQGRQEIATTQRQDPSVSEPLVSQFESKTALSQANTEGYQTLASNAPAEGEYQIASTPSTSFNGSVDELLPGEDRLSPPQFPQDAHHSSKRTPRSSTNIDNQNHRRSHLPSTKVNQLLGAHAIAHEITLQALMRDEDALDKSLQSYAPLHSGDRSSLFPPSVRVRDSRSLADRALSSPPVTNHKRVQVVPPPIDTSVPRGTLPPDLVRTPYPFTLPDKVHRKDFVQSPPSTTSSVPQYGETILALSIRRSKQHSKPRIASLVIPASNDYTAVRSSAIDRKEQYFRAIDFDDSEFFRQLRNRYHKLSGVMRFWSARTLSRIVVTGPATKAANLGYGWLHNSRSPGVVVSKGLNEPFGEDKILQHFRNPALGKSRYDYVHWAHRLAGATQSSTPEADDNVEEPSIRDSLRYVEQPEGLEFVVSWSLLRILLIFFSVIALSIAAALLWVLLGKSTVAADPHGGFRDAGDRITPGVLLGTCTLILGLTGMVGWLGTSWIIV